MFGILDVRSNLEKLEIEILLVICERVFVSQQTILSMGSNAVQSLHQMRLDVDIVGTEDDRSSTTKLCWEFSEEKHSCIPR